MSAPLRRPKTLRSFFATPLADEGRWHPAGRRVKGDAAIYETYLQEPGSPGAVAGLAWMDPRLMSATLYSGSESPGYGPWPYTAPIEPNAARTVVAAFNGGFKFPESNGGYFDYGQTVFPLRKGAASLVIYTNGDATVAKWGRDARMGPDIAAVRQNLTLLVDHGRPVPGLSTASVIAWGATVGGGANVWRSGVGVRADGALVYVAGPSLDVAQLAQLLARAGCIRAMQLDINPAWPTYSVYRPATPDGLASPANGTDLLAGMAGGPSRFFEAWWPRDFITMSARPVSR